LSATRKSATTKSPTRKKKVARKRPAISAKPVTAAELRALQRSLAAKLGPRPATTSRGSTGSTASANRAQPMRWNPDPEDVQRSVAQLVLTIVEFLRQLMERQAIRRMEQKTLTDKEVEAVGLALMQLEETIRDIGRRFGLSPEDLKLDLGPVRLI
jgi:hypothetical protein